MTLRTIIDCSANPLNIRPAVNGSMEVINTRLQNLPKGKTLYVIVGELHALPTHTLLFQSLFEKLNARKIQTSVSLERQHDTLWDLMSKRLHPDLDPKIKPYLLAADKNHHRAIQLYPEAGILPYAPVSKLNADLHFMKAGGPITFHDLSTAPTNSLWSNNPDAFHLNLDDPVTRQFIETHAPEHKNQRIDARFNPVGIDLRNRFWYEAAAKLKSRVCLMNSGVGHLWGDNIDKMPYESSLCHTFEKAGADVVKICLTAQMENGFTPDDLPLEAQSSFDNTDTIQIDGLKEAPFLGSYTPDEEISFTQSVAAASGQSVRVYDFNRIMKECSVNTAPKKRKAWIDQAREDYKKDFSSRSPI